MEDSDSHHPGWINPCQLNALPQPLKIDSDHRYYEMNEAPDLWLSIALLGRKLPPNETLTHYTSEIADRFSAFGITMTHAPYPTVALHFVMKTARPSYGLCPALNTERFWTQLRGALNAHANIRSLDFLCYLIAEITQDHPQAHSIGNHIVNSGLADDVLVFLKTKSVTQINLATCILLDLCDIHPPLAESLISNRERVLILQHILRHALSRETLPLGNLVMCSFGAAKHYIHSNPTGPRDGLRLNLRQIEEIMAARRHTQSSRATQTYNFLFESRVRIASLDCHHLMYAVKRIFEFFRPSDDSTPGASIPVLSGPKFELFKRFLLLARPFVPAIVAAASFPGLETRGAHITALILRDYCLEEVSSRVDEIIAHLKQTLADAQEQFPDEAKDIESDILAKIQLFRSGTHFLLNENRQATQHTFSKCPPKSIVVMSSNGDKPKRQN